MPNEGDGPNASSTTTSNNRDEIFYLETNEETSDVTSSSSSNIEQSTVKNKRDNVLIQEEKKNATESKTTDDGGENKRPRQSTSRSSNTMPTFGITPPNFVPMEEIMKTANEMSRLALVNEIVFNNDFKLEKQQKDSSAEESNAEKLETAVRENMKKAFWDILEEQLAETPPNYKQAISLLMEIKETLLLFLMPQHVQLKNEINEILDLELIQQQVENGIFDFQRYAQYILSVCSRLCCPVRDEMIKKLTEIKEMLPLFRGIFELLEIMRLDFANFYIKQFRPHIQLVSVEYEREKFKQLIETQQKYQIDVLEFTTKWIRRNYESLDLSQETNVKVLFNKVLIASYIDLLKSMDPSFECYKVTEQQPTVMDYPETLLLIRNRVEAVREKVFKVTFICSIFVVTFAAIGEPLQSIKDFRMKLKGQLEAIVNSSDPQNRLQYLKHTELKSILKSAALQVITSIEQAVSEYQVNSDRLKEKMESLRYQIDELASPGNRIRSVMERRILEFIERVIMLPPSQAAAPVQVPSGLSTFVNELIQIAGEYTRLVSYNRAVYSPYYTKIIAEVAGPTHYIGERELNAIEKSFYD